MWVFISKGEMMESQFKTLNILLTISLVLFIVPLILIPYKVMPVPENMENPIIVVAIIFGFLYHVFLGMLASKKNRSVIKWVAISIILSPFGTVVSYPLMLFAKPLEKNK